MFTVVPTHQEARLAIVHGEEASKAAEAALCASDQGRFWDYHDRLLESLDVGNRGVFAAEDLKKVAADLELDCATLSVCLDAGKHAQRVQAEAAEARQRGALGTPTFFVIDAKLVGAQPLAAFKTAIENALRQRRQEVHSVGDEATAR